MVPQLGLSLWGSPLPALAISLGDKKTVIKLFASFDDRQTVHAGLGNEYQLVLEGDSGTY